MAWATQLKYGEAVEWSHGALQQLASVTLRLHQKRALRASGNAHFLSRARRSSFASLVKRPARAPNLAIFAVRRITRASCVRRKCHVSAAFPKLVQRDEFEAQGQNNTYGNYINIT